jgi:leader peptidase (prepilin peptidase)/N-methyltransferase
MVVLLHAPLELQKKEACFFVSLYGGFMMNIYITIIFGILGIASGIAIPVISDRMVIYKSPKKDSGNIPRGLDIKTRGLVVILNGLLWIYAGIRLENMVTAFLVSLLFTVALLISVIDMQIRLIPNELVLLMICLGVPFQILYFGWTAFAYAFICMIAVGLVFTLVGKLVGFEQVGAGDIKLAAAIGLVLGYPLIKIALIGMSAALLVFCLGGLAVKRMTIHSAFPFAPFIMFGTICALTFIIDF